MMKKLDPEMDALGKRKAMAIKIIMEPQEGEAPKALPEELALGEELEETDEAKELAGEEVDEALLGAEDAAAVVEKYAGRVPASLGEKMKLATAKKILEKKEA